MAEFVYLQENKSLEVFRCTGIKIEYLCDFSSEDCKLLLDTQWLLSGSASFDDCGTGLSERMASFDFVPSFHCESFRTASLPPLSVSVLWKAGPDVFLNS
jgi:hypothetical protein